MTDVNSEISAAWSEILSEQKDEQERRERKRAYAILREIPNGTPDSELTAEQKEAWFIVGG